MPIVYTENSDTLFVITYTWKPKLQLLNLGNESFPHAPKAHGWVWLWKYISLLLTKTRSQTKNLDLETPNFFRAKL